MREHVISGNFYIKKKKVFALKKKFLLSLFSRIMSLITTEVSCRLIKDTFRCWHLLGEILLLRLYFMFSAIFILKWFVANHFKNGYNVKNVNSVNKIFLFLCENKGNFSVQDRAHSLFLQFLTHHKC